MSGNFKAKLTALLGQQRQSPFSAGGWATATYIITYALDALLFLPMARLLEPADFGLYTEATLVYAGLVLVVQISLIRALVRESSNGGQSSQPSPTELGQMALATLWLSLLAGLLGAGLCALAGIPLALFFKNWALALIMGWFAPGVLAAALSAVPLALLSRELDFRRRMLPETISVIVAAGCGLTAAFLHAGVYSLVIYASLRAIVSAIVAWAVVWNKPEVRIMRTELSRRGFSAFILHPSAFVSRLLGFGIPASGGELALYARFNVDYAVIAGVRLGEDALGVYNVAWKTTDRPARLLNAFFDEVGYATFARLQSDRARLTRVFLSATRLFMVIAVPVFLGALFVRSELVAVLFGSKWQGMVEPLLPLFILQALWLIFHPSASLLLALGHSRIYAWVNGLSLFLTGLAALLGTNWGIVGVAWAMLVATGAVSLGWGALACYYLKPGAAPLWQTFKLPLLFALTVLPAIALTNWLLAQVSLPAIARLAAALIVAIAVFGLVAWRNWPTLRGDIARLREKLPEEAPPVPSLAEDPNLYDKIEAARP